MDSSRNAKKIEGEPDNKRSKKYYFEWRDPVTKQPIDYDWGNGTTRQVKSKITKEKVESMVAAHKRLKDWYLTQAGNSAEAARKLRSRMIKTRNKKIPMRELMMKDFNRKPYSKVVNYWTDLLGADGIKDFEKNWFNSDTGNWDDEYKSARNRSIFKDELLDLRAAAKRNAAAKNLKHARVSTKKLAELYHKYKVPVPARKKRVATAVAKLSAAVGAPPAVAGAPQAVVAQIIAVNGAPPAAAQVAAAVAAAPPPVAAGDEFDALLDELDSARILANNAADQAYLDGLDAELNELVRKARNTTTPRVLGSYRKKIKEVMKKIRIRVSKMN